MQHLRVQSVIRVQSTENRVQLPCGMQISVQVWPSPLFAYAHQLRSLLFPHGYFSFFLSPFSSLVYLSTKNLTKSLSSFFLTSLNVAQKVKNFKNLTSVKKNLRYLTKFLGKQREFFLLKKKNVLLKKKKFLLKRKKILLQRKFSGGRS